MHVADKRVGPRLQGGHAVVLLVDAGEDVTLEERGPGCVLDLDVVRDARVLVVEGDRECRVRRSTDLGRREGDVLGRDVDDGTRWRTRRTRRSRGARRR